MAENTALAARFRQMYNCILLMRETVHNLIDRKLQLEMGLEDRKQV